MRRGDEKKGYVSREVYDRLTNARLALNELAADHSALSEVDRDLASQVRTLAGQLQDSAGWLEPEPEAMSEFDLKMLVSWVHNLPVDSIKVDYIDNTQIDVWLPVGPTNALFLKCVHPKALLGRKLPNASDGYEAGLKELREILTYEE